MELHPSRPMALPVPRRLDWPGDQHTGAPPAPARARTAEAQIAHKFEAMIAATLLRVARAGELGNDGLGDNGDGVRDMVDTARAEAIARAAPLGVARLLAGQLPPK